MYSSQEGLLTRMSSDPWFGALALHERKMLLSDAVPLRFQPGEYVFRQGDRPNGFYAVVQGALKGSTLLENGKEAILGVIEPGIWFGEASMIDGLPRSHDATALDESRVLRVNMAIFTDLMRRSSFARSIALLQATRMRSLYALIEDATLRSTRARVARQLRRLARADAVASGSSCRVITATQEMLAMMLGITRQTLALELKAMATRGILSIEYGRIRISSMDALREIEQKT
jgi:CRP/FNR family transcriptional regulator, cyclic AMP receptor protein